MRKSFSVLALVFCGLWCGSLAMGSSLCVGTPGNLVVNCGFETGNFTGWTISGNTANPNGNYYGVDAYDANSGSFGAFMSQDFFVGTAPVDLSQTLATVAGDTYQISFFLEQDTAPTTAGYIHAFSATFGGTTMLTLTPTVALPGSLAYTEYTFSETATAPSTTLQFDFENDDNYWSFDDVSVTLTSTASSAPEPSAGLLGGTALVALLLLRRRRYGRFARQI